MYLFFCFVFIFIRVTSWLQASSHGSRILSAHCVPRQDAFMRLCLFTREKIPPQSPWPISPRSSQGRTYAMRAPPPACQGGWESEHLAQGNRKHHDWLHLTGIHHLWLAEGPTSLRSGGLYPPAEQKWASLSRDEESRGELRDGLPGRQHNVPATVTPGWLSGYQAVIPRDSSFEAAASP